MLKYHFDKDYVTCDSDIDVERKRVKLIYTNHMRVARMKEDPNNVLYLSYEKMLESEWKVCLSDEQISFIESHLGDAIQRVPLDTEHFGLYEEAPATGTYGHSINIWLSRGTIYVNIIDRYDVPGFRDNDDDTYEYTPDEFIELVKEKKHYVYDRALENYNKYVEHE